MSKQQSRKGNAKPRVVRAGVAGRLIQGRQADGTAAVGRPRVGNRQQPECKRRDVGLDYAMVIMRLDVEQEKLECQHPGAYDTPLTAAGHRHVGIGRQIDDLHGAHRRSAGSSAIATFPDASYTQVWRVGPINAGQGSARLAGSLLAKIEPSMRVWRISRDASSDATARRTVGLRERVT
jgi:hypothetical protein